MRAIRYIWRVIAELFYLIVVAAVLLSIDNNLERHILSAIGMVYCTIRSIAIIDVFTKLRAAAAHDYHFAVIRSLLLGEQEPLFDPEPETVKPLFILGYISSVFVFLGYLICIAAFFLGNK